MGLDPRCHGGGGAMMIYGRRYTVGVRQESDEPLSVGKQRAICAVAYILMFGGIALWCYLRVH